MCIKCKFYAADTKAMEGKLKMEGEEETVASLNVLLLKYQFRKIVQSDHPYTTHNTEFTTDK